MPISKDGIKDRLARYRQVKITVIGAPCAMLLAACGESVTPLFNSHCADFVIPSEARDLHFHGKTEDPSLRSG